jgi:signal transduction histidine kinase
LANINVARRVRCDLGRVQQVASNLIGNALTHGAPSSPVKVSVRTENHDLVLEVWNAGDPIPAPFHRQQSRRLGVPLEASLQ